jgi:transcriptional regulator with XRE-family HTH domain
MKNLRAARKLRKLTQKDVGEYLNVTYQTYGRYETGKINPDPDTIIKLSKLFNVSADYLLGLIEAPFTPEEAAFMRKIQDEKDPDKISKDYDVYIGDQLVTGKELLELMKKMQKLDEEVHGDFFKKKDH